MTTFATFPVSFNCPRCARRGEADACETMDADGRRVQFSLNTLPPGFSACALPLTRPDLVLVCDCGCELYFPSRMIEANTEIALAG